MVAWNISVRLNENIVIDNSLRTMTPVTSSTILYCVNIWILRRQNLKDCAILILPWYQQHNVRPIYRPTSELYRYDGIPLQRHVVHSVSERYRPVALTNPILMNKHHFDNVLIKVTLCWTDTSADIKWYKYDPIPLRTRYRPFDVRNLTATPEPR